MIRVYTLEFAFKSAFFFLFFFFEEGKISGFLARVGEWRMEGIQERKFFFRSFDLGIIYPCDEKWNNVNSREFRATMFIGVV